MLFDLPQAVSVRSRCAKRLYEELRLVPGILFKECRSVDDATVVLDDLRNSKPRREREGMFMLALSQVRGWVGWTLGLHSFAVLFEFLKVLKPSVESWPWFFSFFLDFPISILIHKALGGVSLNSVSVNSYHYMFLLSHLVIGGLWWILIVYCIRRATWKQA